MFDIMKEQREPVLADNEFAELSEAETDDVSGAIVPIVVGAVWFVGHVGLAAYARMTCP